MIQPCVAHNVLYVSQGNSPGPIPILQKLAFTRPSCSSENVYTNAFSALLASMEQNAQTQSQVRETEGKSDRMVHDFSQHKNNPAQGLSDMNQLRHASAPRAINAKTREPQAARLGRQCRGLELVIDVMSTLLGFRRSGPICLWSCQLWPNSTCHSHSAQQGRP